MTGALVPFVLWNRLPGGAERYVALAALASLALGILWSLQAATGDASYDEVSTVDPWGERGAFTYEPLRPDGTALEMGEPGYFTHDAPRLRVRFTWQLDDAAAERVTALGELRLVGDDITALLAEGTLEGAAADKLTMIGEIDLASLDAQETLAAVATVRFVSAPVTEHKADASEWRMPITLAPPLYTLPGAAALATAKDHAQSSVVHHADATGVAGVAEQPAGPALVLVGMAGLYASLPRIAREEAAA